MWKQGNDFAIILLVLSLLKCRNETVLSNNKTGYYSYQGNVLVTNGLVININAKPHQTACGQTIVECKKRCLNALGNLLSRILQL